MAFLWQGKDKAMIFQSISPGNMLINHRRLGLCYLGWRKESSVVSIPVEWGSLLCNALGYYQGCVASTLRVFGSDGLWLTGLGGNTAMTTDWHLLLIQAGIKVVLEQLAWWCQFSESNKGTTKAVGISCSENDVSLTIFIYYHPHWSMFIFICSKGLQWKRMTDFKGRFPSPPNIQKITNKHTFKFFLAALPPL